MQNWFRTKLYPSDYLNLVYRYYAAHNTRAYCVTYYHFDIGNSNIDTDQLDAGAYETLGEFSGNCYERILLLPVYNVDRINIRYDATEKGFLKEGQTTTFNFPSVYNLIPTAKDFVIFDEPVLNKDDTPFEAPVYQIENFERATNRFFDFWNVSAKQTYHKKSKIEKQVRACYSFVDYEKQVYEVSVATKLMRLLDKNVKLDANLDFKEDIGYYIGV